ncbi:hypothetical protein NKH77_19775 [Streptomyces sp. M19]
MAHRARIAYHLGERADGRAPEPDPGTAGAGPDGRARPSPDPVRGDHPSRPSAITQLGPRRSAAP